MDEQAQTRRRFAGVRIGLTGGIGSGKSMARRYFAAEGFHVLDVDEIVKKQVLVDPEVLAQARQRWGGSVLDTSGQLDRPSVAKIVFDDSQERQWWESVVHPRVGRLWRATLANNPDTAWVVEIPLLFEAGLEKEFDFVVCVAANASTQLSRAVARGLNPTQAEMRIASQLPLAIKLKSSHIVLWNEGSPEFLERQIHFLVSHLPPSSHPRLVT